MDERVARLRVGVMVVATIIITVILVFVFGEFPAVLKPRYTVYLRFSDAPGVSRDTPIKKSGILIGRVTDVELREEGGVMVTARIDKDKLIRQHEVARITTSLLGDSVIHFVDSGRKDLARTPVADGVELEGFAYDDPIQVVAKLQERLAGAIGSITHTSDELGQVIQQVGGILKGNEEKINRIIAQTDETSGLFQQTVRNANDIIGNPETKARIQDALVQVPELMRETRDTVRQFNGALTLLDKNLRNVDQFTTSLGDQGKAMVGHLNTSAANLDEVLAQLAVLTKRVNSGQGTLGRLLTDDELYAKIDRVVGNVEELSWKLRPILQDVRVVSDSMARHGVRGLLERSDGTKW